MKSVLKSLAMYFPAFRNHMQRVSDLSLALERVSQEKSAASAERDRLANEVALLSSELRDGWTRAKGLKREQSETFRATASTSRLVHPIEPLKTEMDEAVKDWIRHQVDAEPYWFQKIEVLPGLFSAGWSDPATEKLPYYGLPEDLTGKRVLDIGCAEGFFSFEAERRGAREVIGIDSFPDSMRRFNLAKAARQSSASAFLMNVYDLEPRRLGTFDLVLFYGVFYHLKHPQYALERIKSVCTGDLLFQTHVYEDPAKKDIPLARYYPHGMLSGANKDVLDPTIFWLFNSECCQAMLDHVGFTDLQVLSADPKPFVLRAKSPNIAPGEPPDQTDSPWC